MNKEFDGKIVVTLGPKGTDCYSEAKRLTERLVLKNTFLGAINYALRHKQYLLLPAGMSEVVNGCRMQWTDINFALRKDCLLVGAWKNKTKPMVFVCSKPTVAVESVAIHPATKALIPNRYQSSIKKCIYAKSKMHALDIFNSGNVDAAIVSRDQFSGSSEQVLEAIHPYMIWSLYDCRKSKINEIKLPNVFRNGEIVNDCAMEI